MESYTLNEALEMFRHDSLEYSEYVERKLFEFKFDIVHIRHLGRHGLSIVSVAKRLQIKVIYSLHDYYSLCPNVKLINSSGKYCDGECDLKHEDTRVELWEPDSMKVIDLELRDNYARYWRSQFAQIIEVSDALVTTSNFAADLISTELEVTRNRIEVIPHGRDFERFSPPRNTPLQSLETVKVLTLGHINLSKGAELIEEALKLDGNQVIEFHVLGSIPENLKGSVIHHGQYKRNDLQKLIQKIKPDMGVILSIWPETYCHTLTELWAGGIPVLVTDFGALGERMRRHAAGWILSSLEPKSLFETILYIKKNPQELYEKNAALKAWQEGYGKSYDTKIMALQYKRIYNQNLSGSVKSPKRRLFILSPENALEDNLISGLPEELKKTVDGAYSLAVDQIPFIDISSVDIVILPSGPESQRALLKANPTLQSAHVLFAKTAHHQSVRMLKFTSELHNAELAYCEPTREGEMKLRLRMVNIYHQYFDWSKQLRVQRTQNLTSIVIPFYNRGDLLELCVRSIVLNNDKLGSKRNNIEVILVNNGSDEVTSTTARKLDIRFDEVKLIELGENLNFSLGCNIGYYHGAGENTVFLNSDTKVIDPYWLTGLIKLIDRPDVGCAGALLMYEDQTIQHLGVQFNPITGLAYHPSFGWRA